MKPKKKTKSSISKSIDVRSRSWFRKFNEEFPSEAHCNRSLWMRTTDEPVPLCGWCQEPNHRFQFETRFFLCGSCGKKTWIFAGTFFEKIRRPRAWLARIWLLERGIVLSSSEFSELLGIASSTSQNIFKKITMAVIEHSQYSTTFPCSAFRSINFRRSAETPANEHPCNDYQSVEESNACSVPQQLPFLSENETIIFELLHDEVMSIDRLLARSGLNHGELAEALLMLELHGLVKQMFGDLVARNQKTAVINYAELLDSRVLSVNEFILRKFHGVSRKYVQLYVCGYWISADRETWKFDNWKKVFRKTAPITDSQVRAYISPLQIQVAS